MGRSNSSCGWRTKCWSSGPSNATTSDRLDCSRRPARPACCHSDATEPGKPCKWNGVQVRAFFNAATTSNNQTDKPAQMTQARGHMLVWVRVCDQRPVGNPRALLAMCNAQCSLLTKCSVTSRLPTSTPSSRALVAATPHRVPPCSPASMLRRSAGV